VTLGRIAATALCAALLSSLARGARASTDDAIAAAQGDLAFVSRNVGSIQTAIAQAKGQGQSPENRLANGELLFRMKDYGRAVVLLSGVIEEFPNTPSYPDALWLRGETYYATNDYLAARRDYRLLVDRSSDTRFQVYLGRALARLVDVSLRLDDPPQALAPVLSKFNQVPAPQVDAALLYAKGKAEYRQGSWNDANAAFAQVALGSAFTHQARYFQGLVAMRVARASAAADPNQKGANYKAAIEAFRAVADLPPDTPEHKHVIDLAWMAVGRLFYEMDQYAQASEAYAKVGRDSPEFDTMLYELAWVYVRMGDVQRAERALEVLMVSNPNSEYIGDATLLRADLLLRAGAFDRALHLYEGIRSEYDPMRAKVEAFLGSTSDVSVYYDKLAQQQLDPLDQREQLPAIAIKWAREAEDGPRAFAVIDEINGTKALIAQCNQLIDKLTSLTQASTRVHAFPELEAGETSALGFLNRLSRARLALARALDSEEPGNLSGEIGDVRTELRNLMAAIQGLPVESSDFGAREQSGRAQWNTVSQELTSRSMEVDALQATINGLRRMLADGPQQGVALDPANVQRFQAELDANSKDLARYREGVAELRREIEMGRSQIGLGDSRYQNDAVARDQFASDFDRALQLAISGGGGAGAQRFAQQASAVVAQIREMEAQLTASIQAIETQVAARAGELRGKLDVERANLANYQQQLDAIDNDGRNVVGHVAQRNFGIVRDKLRGIVLRADVGITEQAWEVREEELSRVRSLQSERARQEQLLDEELKEVRDDGLEPPPPSN
jgi:tetratricopeptide (TPR) repeat protein